MEYQSTSSDFGLTVSIPKVKHMVAGREVCGGDKNPILVSGGSVESVEDFPYLGSIISSSGTVDTEIDTMIAKASRAFGAVRRAVLDRNLTLTTKSKVYQACVLCCMDQYAGHYLEDIKERLTVSIIDALE